MYSVLFVKKCIIINHQHINDIKYKDNVYRLKKYVIYIEKRKRRSIDSCEMPFMSRFMSRGAGTILYVGGLTNKTKLCGKSRGDQYIVFYP